MHTFARHIMQNLPQHQCSAGYVYGYDFKTQLGATDRFPLMHIRLVNKQLLKENKPPDAICNLPAKPHMWQARRCNVIWL